MKIPLPEVLKKQLRLSKSLVGSIYYGLPSKKLILLGVTGTSGKSTTSHMLYHVLDKAGLKVGLISTVTAQIGDKKMDTGFHVTTPDPVQMQKILRFLKANGALYVVVETSSHALAQGRLGFLRFDYAIYTNITSDHIDWHKTWEHYAKSKATLINKVKNGGFVVLNADDKKSYSFLSQFISKRKRVIGGINYDKSELTKVEESAIGLKFSYESQIFTLPLIGQYNLENALAVIKVCTNLGLSLKNISQALSTFEGVEGRMQVMLKNPFYVIVDFAHNTDALEKSLIEAKRLVGKKGKLIVVFGSAGLRDFTRRAPMGKVAASLADVVILTAEDPRVESLSDINAQILEGASDVGGKLVKRFANHKEYKSYQLPVDSYQHKNWNLGSGNSQLFVFDEESVDSRYDAIDLAVKLANPGDVVITEGKGHEKSLCFGTTEFPFTDQEAVNKAIRNLSTSSRV